MNPDSISNRRELPSNVTYAMGIVCKLALNLSIYLSEIWSGFSYHITQSSLVKEPTKLSILTTELLVVGTSLVAFKTSKLVRTTEPCLTGPFHRLTGFPPASYPVKGKALRRVTRCLPYRLYSATAISILFRFTSFFVVVSRSWVKKYINFFIVVNFIVRLF